MPRDIVLPQPTGPNGDLLDPSVVPSGRAFEVNWAFVDESPTSFVYEVYNRHHELMYVGITDNFAARWSAHRHQSWWARSLDIPFVMLYGYRSRFEARLVEALTIHELHPPCNTKPEIKYLGIARTMPRPQDVLTAELEPKRTF